MRVSVLIPAFRPDFLGPAIASVLTQGVDDYELLINDDSGGDAVEKVVDRFRDPRIRYSRTKGREGTIENMRQLWALAGCDLVKFLFDDDLLNPNAIDDLVQQVERKPDATYVFGHRDLIDGAGRIIGEPRLVAAGKAITLSRSQLAEIMLPGCNNRVGELSNSLINRAAGVSLEDDVFTYRGFHVEMLHDVALFLNAADKGSAIGLGRTVGQYRKHGQQNSAHGFSPGYAKVVSEWELFVRGEYSAGLLGADAAQAASVHLDRLYDIFATRLPELAILKQGLPRFREQIAAGDRDIFDEGFRTRWAELDRLIAERRNAAA